MKVKACSPRDMTYDESIGPSEPEGLGMTESEAMSRQAHRGELLSALLRHSAHELRNIAQVLGITTDAIQGNPAVGAVYRDAIARSNESLLALLERLERANGPDGGRAAPFAVADPVELAVALATRRGPASHLEVQIDVPRTLRPCSGVESALAEATFALLSSMGEMTRGARRSVARITARELAEGLELLLSTDARATEPCLQERWSLGVSRARMLLRDWGGNIEAAGTADGQLRATFRLPYWRRVSVVGIAPALARL